MIKDTPIALRKLGNYKSFRNSGQNPQEGKATGDSFPLNQNSKIRIAG